MKTELMLSIIQVMKNSSLFLVFGLMIVTPARGQEIETAIPQVGLADISQVNQGNSYITFPTDIGNIDKLWFEANIIPNFLIRKSKNSRLMGVLTPQIILRMYREVSCPVRTPSYIPQITIYYLIGNRARVENLTLFGRFAHHSNGQEGNFYLENGEINYMSGDFSTNYLEAGLIVTNYNRRLNAYQFFSTSFEVHPKAWSAVELHGEFSHYRWHQAFSIFKLPPGRSPKGQKNANISLKAETIWMFGEISDWTTISLDRLNIKLTFYYHPKFFEDLGLFVQIYHGMDYYNIYFNQQIDVIRFGIMTEKLRF